MFNFKKIKAIRGGNNREAFITVSQGGTVNANQAVLTKIPQNKKYIIVSYDDNTDAIMLQFTNNYENGAYEYKKGSRGYLFSGVFLYRAGAKGRYHFFSNGKQDHSLIFVKKHE